ncbi:tetratricopeptide repeat protein [Thalassotalea euphylliae]|uniref:tetratricopeptide repeat protein n=1 Tax=Thalassotalea euphylliae TaxID=1655234 RepID=UPI00363E109E
MLVYWMKDIIMKLLCRLVLIAAAISASSAAFAAKIEPCDTEECVTYFKKFKTGANRGSADAMATLGQFYYFGYGTEPDIEKAFYYLKRSARLGNLAALYKLGLFYLSDKEHQDLNKGLRYLEKSAFRHYRSATFLLGITYYNKDFGAFNQEKADIYLAKAYEQRHHDMPTVIDYIQEREEITPDKFPLLHKALTKTPLAKQNNISEWPSDEVEVITVTSMPLKAALDQQIISFRKPAKSLGSRLPTKSCQDSMGCYVTWGIDGLNDFPFLTIN